MRERGARVGLSNAGRIWEGWRMNTAFSAIMIVWIFWMVIYLTRDL